MLRLLILLLVLGSCTKSTVEVAPPMVAPPTVAPSTGKGVSSNLEKKGKTVTWYESGSPKTKEYYEGGKLLQGEYFTLENRLESSVVNGWGVRTRRDHFGDLLSLDTIENGEMVLRVLPHANGSPKEMIPYVEGVIEGVKKSFSEDGEPLTVETWKGGVQEGVTIVYQNGERYAEVPYVRGAKEGIEKRYRKGKTLIEEISWSQSKRHGASYTYIGESVKTDWYFEGRQVTKKQFESLREGS